MAQPIHSNLGSKTVVAPLAAGLSMEKEYFIVAEILRRYGWFQDMRTRLVELAKQADLGKLSLKAETQASHTTSDS